jgi:hypothetical protein
MAGTFEVQDRLPRYDYHSLRMKFDHLHEEFPSVGAR